VVNEKEPVGFEADAPEAVEEAESTLGNLKEGWEAKESPEELDDIAVVVAEADDFANVGIVVEVEVEEGPVASILENKGELLVEVEEAEETTNASLLLRMILRTTVKQKKMLQKLPLRHRSSTTKLKRIGFF